MENLSGAAARTGNVKNSKKLIKHIRNTWVA